jgi:hypothetical protein
MAARFPIFRCCIALEHGLSNVGRTIAVSKCWQGRWFGFRVPAFSYPLVTITNQVKDSVVMEKDPSLVSRDVLLYVHRPGGHQESWADAGSERQTVEGLGFHVIRVRSVQSAYGVGVRVHSFFTL